MTSVSRLVGALLLGTALMVGAASAPALATVRHTGAPASAATTPTAAQTLQGTVVSVSGAVLLAQMSDGVQHTYHVAATVPVTRNSHAGHLDALQPGDQVTVITDAAGNVTNLDAAGAEQSTAAPGAGATRATVIAAWGTGIAARLSSGGVHDYRLAPGLRVTRNGQASHTSALRPGDTLTVTTDAAGNLTSVDATGRPDTTRTTTAADAAAMAAPPLIGLLVAALALLYRAVRGAPHPE